MEKLENSESRKYIRNTLNQNPISKVTESYVVGNQKNVNRK